MKLVISKSPWEVWGDPLEQTLGRIAADGYDAVEVNLFDRPEPVAELQRMLRSTALPVIVQINSGGGSAEEQCRALERRYEHALFAQPALFNCHTGRDHFSFEDNLRVFEHGERLVEKHGIPLVHETHRGRAMFSVPATVQFLRQMPTLRLTADLSHFFCVHESDLADQEASLAQVIEHVDHIHARVGFNEGPQVSDPRNPAHADWVARSMGLWKRILDSARARGVEKFAMTPEFGPPGYMPLSGRSEEPVADAWEINRWMAGYLRETFS